MYENLQLYMYMKILLICFFCRISASLLWLEQILKMKYQLSVFLLISIL